MASREAAKAKDKFYTKPEAVQVLLGTVDLTKYDLIVEPAAGSGNISLRIPNCIAFDIEPEHSSIVQKDFLNDIVLEMQSCKNCLVITNPPFGTNASSAIAFFNRAAEYPSVKTLAFIVPKTFRKRSVINRLNFSFLLSKEIDIPDKSFTLANRDHAVPCLIQVWNRSPFRRAKIPDPVEDKTAYYFVKEEEAHQLTQKGTKVLLLTRVGIGAGYNNKLYNREAFMKESRNNEKASDQSRMFLVPLIDPLYIADELNKIEWPVNTVGQRSVSKSEFIDELDRIAREYRATQQTK